MRPHSCSPREAFLKQGLRRLHWSFCTFVSLSAILIFSMTTATAGLAQDSSSSSSMQATPPDAPQPAKATSSRQYECVGHDFVVERPGETAADQAHSGDHSEFSRSEHGRQRDESIDRPVPLGCRHNPLVPMAFTGRLGGELARRGPRVHEKGATVVSVVADDPSGHASR